MNTLPFSAVVLHVEHLGHVPSFKNKKRICGQNLVTNSKVKQWMDRCIASFESQLRSCVPTTEGATLTEPQLRSWIASSLPWDDSRQWIPELTVTARQVAKGMEGATLVITLISDPRASGVPQREPPKQRESHRLTHSDHEGQ